MSSTYILPRSVSIGVSLIFFLRARFLGSGRCSTCDTVESVSWFTRMWKLEDRIVPRERLWELLVLSGTSRVSLHRLYTGRKDCSRTAVMSPTLGRKQHPASLSLLLSRSEETHRKMLHG